MNYETKYKEILEMAREAYYSSETPHIAKAWLLTMFPEITESEDEKIRKSLIRFLKSPFVHNYITDEKVAPWLDWLEKQGEYKPYGQRKECEDCQFNYAGECKGYCALKRNEQKPILDVKASDWYVSKVDGKIHNMYYSVDKVEPKFKVGDWVVNSTTLNLCHILKVEHGQYIYDDCSFPITNENEYHLWTIRDAKDGDVLVASDGSIFLFAGVVDCACKYYVALTADNYLKINKETKGGYWETSRAVHPATKKQRDLLFQKMADAGYEWDGEKKELKKVGSKTFNEWLDEYNKRRKNAR